MENLADYHPIAVHFPIAFIFIYILSEIIYLFLPKSQLQQLSFFLLIVGIIGGVVSVITGNLEFQILQDNPLINQNELQLIENHSDLATVTMWYYFGILFFKTFIMVKKKKGSTIHYLFVIFVIAGGYLLYKTANIGGILVYKFGIGTDLIQ